MNTKSKLVSDYMEKILTRIDKRLVDYYNSIIKHSTGNEQHYKKELNNFILSFYFQNKLKFSCVPLVLSKSFAHLEKGIITLSMNEVNNQLFTFFCLSNHRSGKQEAEYIMTCFLITLKDKKVDSISFNDKGLVFFKKNRSFKF